MEILNVLAAALASYAFGSIWYMSIAKQWMVAAQIEVGEDGKPANAANPIPYIVAFAMMVVVAGMMRHMFALSGIDTVGKGLVAGAGVGAFIVLPWLTTHYMFSDRPKALIWMDGVYNVVGCALIGLVLTLF